MKKRKPKKSDQSNTEKAYQILRNTIKSHPGIDNNLWAGALWSLIVAGYRNSGIDYEEFCKEVDAVTAHYKNWWKE